MSIADRYTVEYENDTGTNVVGPDGIIKMDSIADKARELNKAFAQGHADAVKLMATKPKPDVVQISSPPMSEILGQQKVALQEQLKDPKLLVIHKDMIRSHIANIDEKLGIKEEIP